MISLEQKTNNTVEKMTDVNNSSTLLGRKEHRSRKDKEKETTEEWLSSVDCVN